MGTNNFEIRELQEFEPCDDEFKNFTNELQATLDKNNFQPQLKQGAEVSASDDIDGYNSDSDDDRNADASDPASPESQDRLARTVEQLRKELRAEVLAARHARGDFSLLS